MVGISAKNAAPGTWAGNKMKKGPIFDFLLSPLCNGSDFAFLNGVVHESHRLACVPKVTARHRRRGGVARRSNAGRTPFFLRLLSCVKTTTNTTICLARCCHVLRQCIRTQHV